LVRGLGQPLRRCWNKIPNVMDRASSLFWRPTTVCPSTDGAWSRRKWIRPSFPAHSGPALTALMGSRTKGHAVQASPRWPAYGELCPWPRGTRHAQGLNPDDVGSAHLVDVHRSAGLDWGILETARSSPLSYPAEEKWRDYYRVAFPSAQQIPSPYVADDCPTQPAVSNLGVNDDERTDVAREHPTPQDGGGAVGPSARCEKGQTERATTEKALEIDAPRPPLTSTGRIADLDTHPSFLRFSDVLLDPRGPPYDPRDDASGAHSSDVDPGGLSYESGEGALDK